MLTDGDFRAEECTSAEREAFASYLEGQISKIDLPVPDYEFLRERILRMYANPAINKGALRPV